MAPREPDHAAARALAARADGGFVFGAAEALTGRTFEMKNQFHDLLRVLTLRQNTAKKRLELLESARCCSLPPAEGERARVRGQEDRTNVKHRTSAIEHRTSKIERRTRPSPRPSPHPMGRGSRAPRLI